MSGSKSASKSFRPGLFSLRYKIAFSVLTVFITIYSISMTYSYNQRKESVFSSARQEMISTVQILAAILYRNYSLKEDGRSILSYIKGIQKYKPDILQIEVIDTGAVVVASFDLDRMLTDVRDEGVRQGLNNKMSLDLSQTQATVAVTYPISAELDKADKKVFGIIRLKVSLLKQMKQLTAIANNMILTALIIGLTIVAVIVYLSFTITKPVGLLTELLGRVNDGDLTVSAAIQSRDELGFLGESFNGMVKSLNLSNAENKRYARSLEDSNRRLSDLNQAASRFVPAEFLNHLAKDDLTQVQLGDAVLRKMTVLFLDIRNFTSLSEQMNESDNLSFINALLKRLNPRIAGNGGFIDKFIGDAIMALFPRSADDALQAALAMRRELKEYNNERTGHGKITIDFGIGINSGPLILGTVGSPARMDTTVIGKTVNLASRMEGLTKAQNSPIVVSENSYQKLSPSLADKLTSLGKLPVKGVQDPVQVYGTGDP